MLNLLYIEDDPADFLLVSRHLQRQNMQANMVRVDDWSSLLSALGEMRWDAILADYKVPGLDFQDTLGLLANRLPDTPIILVSGSVGEEVAVELLKRGVWDFVIKDRLARLCPALERCFSDREQRLARQAAERALRESEERFRLIAASISEVIWMADIDLRQVFYASPAFENVWQQPCSALYENPRIFSESIHPDDRKRALDIVLSAHKAGGAFDLEYRIVRPDGSVRWIRDRGQQASFPSMSVSCYVGVAQDVTERHWAEEKLRQAATVFESTRDGVIIAALDGSILAVNKAFTEITGYSEAEALGRNPRMLQSDRQGPEFYQAIWSSLRQNGQWQGELWDRRKSGESFPAWMTISAVCDAQDNVTHYVGVFSDITQLKRSEERLAHLAHYDPLTDLPNRVLLQLRLAHAMERAQRLGCRVAVMFIDLDRFNTVNDSLGHLAGDQLLIDVARRLSAQLKGEATLGRFGGDEFLLLLDIDELDAAATTAQKQLDALAAPFLLSGNNEVYLGASIGISIFPNDGTKAADLLRDADAAMYRAKELGRNRFCFYTAAMNAEALAQLELEAGLRRALERNEFALHYQPKVNLRTGQIIGAEALIRWQRPGSGLEMPGRFVTLAERTGLIVPMGSWVIDEACRQLRCWRDAGWLDLRLAVNVSERQFYSGDLQRIVSDALARNGVPPACLELEVTESMLMEDPQQTIAILQSLKRIGVKLSLDDFGTGYSGFAYLSRFPIDALKIDQSFVRDIVTEPESALIAVSIIELAHRMGLKVVAEGVETEAQLGYLQMHDCDEMQGYFFAKPVPAESFLDFMIAGKTLSLTRLPPLAAEHTLLLVDDEPNILSALSRLLRREGYHILTAGSGREGLELLATHPVQVILSDQRMPEMAGTEFLHRVKELHPDTVRIVLSGYADLESVTLAVNEGAIYKFLYKPWDDALLQEHIRDAFLYYEAVIKPRAGRIKG
ncbi:response regulator receiver modulated diguanylate cyclase/phosphodiesterase with PAS/PAC sensor(s) [Formivibrio citricus]|uniref:Response regulator receiver modulated diguanylate cyclase/phosphodiesterase with PAS/PAC sensor(S) n=1 Tax=Formivibrio citricus TaxID=83765 RepID=A0A1I5D605_9NEIS|nr:EAL domain-containing protein [Formivibrio citricus]SFN94556.1 response regulator receiver modulated diguanylate cyclase/phosphodiesterase with PAS/PAC sensor(s) [Formivibrio citricus]